MTRRSTAKQPQPIETEEDDSHIIDQYAIPVDRISPAVSGGLMGFVAGVASLAVVYGLEPTELTSRAVSVAQARGVDMTVAFVVAGITCASLGALIGATFAVVTRYLRKWVPLLIWAVIFFLSLAMLVVSTASAYGRGVPQSLAGPICAASVVFGLIVSFSLPIRRRR